MVESVYSTDQWSRGIGKGKAARQTLTFFDPCVASQKFKCAKLTHLNTSQKNNHMSSSFLRCVPTISHHRPSKWSGKQYIARLDWISYLWLKNSYGKIHHFQSEIPLFPWLFSSSQTATVIARVSLTQLRCRCAQGSFLCSGSGCLPCPKGLWCPAGLELPQQQPGRWTPSRELGGGCGFQVLQCHLATWKNG